mmetsp:Transcript_682/g.2417  ORF Transcript_682/g.2417 Transcript_682/m.2417 type:complete len:278 (+) Transcript_682:48-881(+)
MEADSALGWLLATPTCSLVGEYFSPGPHDRTVVQGRLAASVCHSPPCRVGGRSGDLRSSASLAACGGPRDVSLARCTPEQPQASPSLSVFRLFVINPNQFQRPPGQVLLAALDDGRSATPPPSGDFGLRLFIGSFSCLQAWRLLGAVGGGSLCLPCRCSSVSVAADHCNSCGVPALRGVGTANQQNVCKWGFGAAEAVTSARAERLRGPRCYFLSSTRPTRRDSCRVRWSSLHWRSRRTAERGVSASLRDSTREMGLWWRQVLRMLWFPLPWRGAPA